MRVRVRNNYSKEGLLNKLDKSNWNFKRAEGPDGITRATQVENNINKLSKNLRKALSKVEPWKQHKDIINKTKEVETSWLAYKRKPGDEHLTSGNHKS